MGAKARSGSARTITCSFDLARRLKEGLREAGTALLTPMEDALSVGVVIIAVPAASRCEVFSPMDGDHGIAALASGESISRRVFTTRRSTRNGPSPG